jgi:hypothetical protein
MNMTQSNETKPQGSGWMEEDRVYTVIRNRTKNSKVVLSTLNGIEIAPGQTLDLRTAFRKSQVIDAAHEIASLISTGHLEDVANPTAPVAVGASGGAPTAAEMASKMRASKLRDISDSTSMSMLADWINDKDPEVAKAAKVRSEVLLGTRDEDGKLIPGNEEETEAKPTEIIRSPIGGGDPALAQAAAPQPALTAAGLTGGAVHRAE